MVFPKNTYEHMMGCQICGQKLVILSQKLILFEAPTSFVTLDVGPPHCKPIADFGHHEHTLVTQSGDRSTFFVESRQDEAVKPMQN